MTPKCCFIPEGTLDGCASDATHVLVYGPAPDDYTEACIAHVADLIPDSEPVGLHEITAPIAGNTHYAVTIGDSMEMTLVASGDWEFCTKSLASWLEKHPLSEFGQAEIVKRDPANVKAPVTT